ncbi:helix-turn-helix domain-containing protein [Mycobacteroides saopaulense]|uniref:helix-turn-helix domain-containing protein n=1 Tax=Mycobacteroides saopaulense TaxID=1578165 RepID=UPI0009F6498F|nr:helix-turn-helix domain-containing protein [Mycobacteroides saopaulense]
MSTAIFDSHTKDILRVLGETALRLADGQVVDSSQLNKQLLSTTPTDNYPLPTLSTGLLTVPEACGRLRISRWSFYQLIHRRQIETLTIGRRRLVPATEIDRFVRDLAPAGGTA